MKKIYGCDKCGYKQDFSPNNQRLMALIFPDYPIGYCPACITCKNEDTATLLDKMYDL